VKNYKISITTACHLLIISVVGALIYSNTLTTSFQFDDKLNIVDNLFIRDIGNLWPPTGSRWFGLLSFSLNYLAGGHNPFGYHLVNICIHILTALSVYLFVLLTFRTPYFNNRNEGVIPDRWFAFACALLFVAHPIQTQAVTYIVQRFASLATLLFMLSLDCYILARLISGNGDNDSASNRTRYYLARVSAYVAACIFALLSLKTKENAYTLPLVVVMYDLMFISGLSALLAIIRKQWKVAVSLSALALGFLLFVNHTYGLLALFDKLKATNEISRHDYLITQFRVIITYIRLLFIPVNQTIDHHLGVYRNVFTLEIMASLALIVLLLISAGYLLKVSCERTPYLRLVSFGIFWFFITLSIESSIIPIIDVMFEHRLYLPSIGAILAVTALLVHALGLLPLKHNHLQKSATGILAIVIVVLSSASYVRNRVWKNELTLWADVIAKKPLNPRGYNMVGMYFQGNFRIYEAIGYFRKALEVDSGYAEARSNLGNAYILTGNVDEGLNELMITARSNRFDEIDTGILYYNIAKGYHRKGLPDQAIENLNKALRYLPDEPAFYSLLGEVYLQKNLPELGAVYLKKAHELNPLKY
jgi:tetratricopeptide (TPR) repeat protein